MTDPTQRRRPILSPSKRELRWWLLAVLAATHAFVGSRLGSVEEPDAAESIPEESIAAEGGVWLDTLAVSDRPAITVPEGWEVVTATRTRPAVTRVARNRASRVRTRSS